MASLALEQGFNVFLPVYDGGVDFILYRESDGLVHKVQLKARWTIDRKYIGREIWIAFPIAGDGYLMPHDDMLASAEADGVTKTASWIDDLADLALEAVAHCGVLPRYCVRLIRSGI